MVKLLVYCDAYVHDKIKQIVAFLNL